MIHAEDSCRAFWYGLVAVGHCCRTVLCDMVWRPSLVAWRPSLVETKKRKKGGMGARFGGDHCGSTFRVVVLIALIRVTEAVLTTSSSLP